MTNNGEPESKCRLPESRNFCCLFIPIFAFPILASGCCATDEISVPESESYTPTLCQSLNVGKTAREQTLTRNTVSLPTEFDSLLDPALPRVNRIELTFATYGRSAVHSQYLRFYRFSVLADDWIDWIKKNEAKSIKNLEAFARTIGKICFKSKEFNLPQVKPRDPIKFVWKWRNPLDQRPFLFYTFYTTGDFCENRLEVCCLVGP